ncbi:tRNA 5-methoxyuridine(34)/uridine 5-oxyacetic acid(34) synthase CmoB [Halopseudomonas salegens]|uniref:tRNA U34 carboxymethyltransferase n=1 Tax=Halopseudomonas salegens TaxID=1434072 RepID=A0A1H2EU11_9GAMM|nr:tRNA 5-methoxyuridine(34)/uridine 5-oxyacetic acid(34) synthase CmoB [Halopseudomonas salegens]SDT98575.1 tRNA (mo5U34)-methyltransferase [Halopseudomonas salegens]
MINTQSLFTALADTPLASWSETLQTVLAEREHSMQLHGDWQRWQASLQALPASHPGQIELVKEVRVGSQDDLTTAQQTQLREGLMGLHPWRKGPFHLFGQHIDCEWRSDWKWQRVAPHIDLHNRRVLDIGSGNGYYLWRMLGAGAQLALGVDPNLLFLHQFQALKHYLPDLPAWQLPLTLEQLPVPPGGFDTVFSMGVLYHRRSPIDHLLQLKACLRPGGELVLETLVIEGDERACLLPEDRYAQMRNVWFLPSVALLERFLARCGFHSIHCVDLCPTLPEEQRSTEWMRFQSLPDFLDPDNLDLTVEGYPAPLRATLVARI